MTDATGGRILPGRRAIPAGLGALLAIRGLPRARAAPAPPDRTVTLGWRRDAVLDLALPAALAYGLLDQYGIELRLVEADPDGAALPAMLADRRVDAVLAPALLLLGPLREGLDARLTAGVSAGGLRLLADRHAGIRRIEDIRHRRIGVLSTRGAARAFFSILARRKGVDPIDDVAWVEVASGQEEQALRAGTVEALALPDPYAFALLGRLRLVEVASALTGFYRTRVSSVLACSGGLIRDRGALAAGLSRAILRAANRIGRAPGEAAILARPLAPMLDAPAIETMLRTGEQLAEHPAGAALVDDIAAYADELRLLGSFPFELRADRFAASVCLDLAHRG